ncbi:MAG: UDP-N-acetylmuramyl-tripeptide synthetase [Candidatus Zambryskibacteria bacterium]
MHESRTLEKILRIGRKIIPKKIFKLAQPIYHYKLALLGAIIYRFPAKKLTVIGITGTKGKTTTVELVNAILEEAGYKTALASTLRYKIGEKEWRNMFKMTLRGRFFTQSFLRQALDAGCTHAVIEMSSEGVPQFRHKFLFLNTLIFTNLAPEHIESHGSYENYLKAKLEIAKEVKNAIIANIDDKEGQKFLDLNIKNKIPYSLSDAINVKANEKGSSFQIDKTVIHSKLPGTFNVYNMLGAIAYARFAGISPEIIKKGLEEINFIRGRMEKINEGQDFDVVVDYAHTPDSLKAIYETYHSCKKICVLGNTGGGRDKWKREEMGKIADKYCDQIILTNEDPYDEDPTEIVEDIKKGIKKKPVEIIMDRREAIHKAIRLAFDLTPRYASPSPCEGEGKIDTRGKVAVLITGKGTDPYIMGPNGSRMEWDDATVAREELKKVLRK